MDSYWKEHKMEGVVNHIEKQDEYMRDVRSYCRDLLMKISLEDMGLEDMRDLNAMVVVELEKTPIKEGDYD